MKSFLMVTVLSAGLVNCGQFEIGDSVTTNAKATPTPAVVSIRDEGLHFRGFVVGAFAITVDGKQYDDSEDFYTHEIDTLDEKVSAAGYGSEWKATLEAVVGFSDLRNNMKVYIAPKENRGYLGEGVPGAAGAFDILLPYDAKDTVYQVRAIKRINIVLSSASETRKICYNFSAIDKSVPFAEADKPILLDQFVTKVTAYACDSEQINSNGIVVPKIKVAQDVTGTGENCPPSLGGGDDTLVTSPTATPSPHVAPSVIPVRPAENARED